MSVLAIIVIALIAGIVLLVMGVPLLWTAAAVYVVAIVMRRLL